MKVRRKPQRPLRLFSVEKLDVLLYNGAIRKTGLNGGELVLTKESIISTLDELRISQKNTLFTDVVAKEWEKLELKDESVPNPTLLENLLIQVIENLYDEEKAELAAKKRECAIKHDISLLMFGLLDGYYHTIISQGVKTSVKLSIRYNQYLDTNVYVNLEYANEGTYAEIVVKDMIEHPGSQNRPLNHITRIATDCKEQIGSALFDLIDSGDYKNCSQDSVFNERTGQRTDLPKPCFTLEKYIPRTSTGRMIAPTPEAITPNREAVDAEETDEHDTFDEEMPRDKRSHSQLQPGKQLDDASKLIHLISVIWWKILIIILTLALCIAVTIFVLGGNYSHMTTRRERPAGFQEDPQRTEQEWLEEYRYVGPLAKEHVD